LFLFSFPTFISRRLLGLENLLSSCFETKAQKEAYYALRPALIFSVPATCVNHYHPYLSSTREISILERIAFRKTSITKSFTRAAPRITEEKSRLAAEMRAPTSL
jgi:hypothetical protein